MSHLQIMHSHRVRNNYVTLHWPCLTPLGPISAQIKIPQHSTKMQPSFSFSQYVKNQQIRKGTNHKRKDRSHAYKSLRGCLTSARAWRHSWCCRRRLVPAAPWSSAPSAPPGFPSLSPTPAAERGSGWLGAMQVRKQKKKRGGKSREEREEREGGEGESWGERGVRTARGRTERRAKSLKSIWFNNTNISTEAQFLTQKHSVDCCVTAALAPGVTFPSAVCLQWKLSDCVGCHMCVLHICYHHGRHVRV